MNFSSRLKELRKEKKLSQYGLAKATGISQSAIARWELNKNEPTSSDLIKLSKFFNVNIEYLLGLSDY